MNSPQQSPLPFASPKRKRDSDGSLQSSPSFSPTLARINTDVREFPFSNTDVSGENTNNGSPRSAVASQLHSLDLREPVVRQLAFFNDGGRARKRFAQMSKIEDLQGVDHQDGCRSIPNSVAKDPSTPGGSSSTEDNTLKKNNLEEIGGVEMTDAANGSHLSEDLFTIKDRPCARNRSPSLDGDPAENPLTWHDSEITGHDPKDPNDDGYGINGIGFKPTPAIAWARSQRRKQQVAEYKTREAREARHRRSERRRTEGWEAAVSDATSRDDETEKTKKAVRVRFDDGG
ncbi:MAG: hypothetical protein Q9227_005680 [Pyrenula ochraceoflavens]